MIMRLFLFLVSRNGLSRFVGWAAGSRPPKWLLQKAMAKYIQFYNVDLSEVEASLESFETFNDFFTRTLKPGARPIGDGPLVSPVDGVLSQSGSLRGGILTQIKGKTYTLEGLLGSGVDADRFSGGSYATIYLSPRDYHRIHSPVEGRIERFSIIPGKLYPVNQMALPRINSLFSVNERWTTYMDSDQGQVAMVKVGATSVGAVSVSYDPRITNKGDRTRVDETLKTPLPIGKGEEVARFNLGSTVVLLTEHPCPALEAIESDTPVKLGQVLSAKALV